eukprot:m.225114 g.225114  ORF g.225114 m.225114 type:complete len:403 (+) comp26380_c0_seq7:87-1295(+)
MQIVLAFMFACLGVAVARDDALGRYPLMGWNTWCTQNTCGVDWCNEAEILDVADTMIENGMQAAGYEYINLDDCWGVRDPETGKIEGDPLRFPNGMKSMISQLHAKGFKFGLYTDIGYKACHSPFTGSLGHIKEDAQAFADWGVDLVKDDGCQRSGEHLVPSNITCAMSQALNETGRQIWLYFHCQDPKGSWCSKCGDSFRMGPDHHDDWDSTYEIITGTATEKYNWTGIQGWPDFDFVMTGGQGCSFHSEPGIRCPGQTNQEYITEFSVWAIASGSLLVATEIRNMSDFQRSVLLNSEVLAVFNDSLGQLATVVSQGSPNNTMVFARPLSTGGAAAALVNLDSVSHDVEIAFADVPQRKWSGSTAVNVRDLWKHADVAKATGSYSATVCSHCTVLVTLTPA